MLTLDAADTLSGIASAASAVTCSVFGMDLDKSVTPNTETYKALGQSQLGAAAASIIGGAVPTSHTFMVKTILVVNTDSVARTFQLFRGGTAQANAITPVWTLGPSEAASYEDGRGWCFYTATGELKNVVASNGWLVKRLGSDVSNSTTTNAAIAGLDVDLAIGTYVFEYWIRYQAAAATTGVKFAVDYQGTVSWITVQGRYVDASATASTGAPTQNAPAAATAQVMGAFSARADNTTLGPTASVDTLAADMMMIIEGVIEVSTANVLRLLHGSEVAAASTVKAGSVVRLLKAA